ncbi:MAG: hypothetical protein JNJ73_10310 [Hyphomonadaceae bacterium]|nr:hypothetical protein [Hyphomonadaceae bacterium]
MARELTREKERIDLNPREAVGPPRIIPTHREGRVAPPRVLRSLHRRALMFVCAAKGVATHLPPVGAIVQRRSRGSDDARYCYSVWLRHLVVAHRSGFCRKSLPSTIAELGPGDSFGVGLAALLCGAERYHAFDCVASASAERNLAIFDRLVELFEARANIPGPDEFPLIKPLLENYAFPHDLLTPERLAQSLAPARVARLRRALETLDESVFTYCAPWPGGGAASSGLAGAVDMIVSQAVMLYADDLVGLYAEQAAWLKPGGFMSHQLEFTALNFAAEWNGHWTYSDALWRLVTGNRSYVPNRAPHSAHVEAIEAAGLHLVTDWKVMRPSAVKRAHLAPRFSALSRADLTTSATCIQAVKPP